jgi:hypothetical protein
MVTFVYLSLIEKAVPRQVETFSSTSNSIILRNSIKKVN